MSGKSRYSIDILEVTLDLLELLAQDASTPLKASELARRLGVTHNRVFRILKTLQARGYVEAVSPSEGYQLGPGFIPLGARVSDRIDLGQVADPILADLVERTGDAVYLVIRSGSRAMIIDRRVGHHPVQVTVGIGETFPLLASASGRLLLAQLPEAERDEVLDAISAGSTDPAGGMDDKGLVRRLSEIRSRGYELDEESINGAYAIAAAIHDHTGGVVATLTVTTPDVRYSASRRDELVTEVTACARELSTRLGYSAGSRRSARSQSRRLYWQPRPLVPPQVSEFTRLGMPVRTREDKDRFESEAISVVEAAQEQGITLRLLGALGFALRCPRYNYLQGRLGRTYSDINFGGYRAQASEVGSFFASLGYREDPEINLMYAGQQMIFYHPIIPNLHVDVFFDKLDFCHQISWIDRLELDPLTLPLAELLMEKLQIVEINEKDIIDVIVLLLEHRLGDADEGAINMSHIAGLCGNDWGMWRTFLMNLTKISQMAQAYDDLDHELKARLGAQIAALKERIEREPKSLAWKLRARVGDRVKWYQDVDEIV